MNTEKIITLLEQAQYAWTVVGNSSPDLAEMATAQHRAAQDMIDELQGNCAQAVTQQPYPYEA